MSRVRHPVAVVHAHTMRHHTAHGHTRVLLIANLLILLLLRWRRLLLGWWPLLLLLPGLRR
jgi:hypothetical protein